MMQEKIFRVLFLVLLIDGLNHCRKVILDLLRNAAIGAGKIAMRFFIKKNPIFFGTREMDKAP